MLLRWFQVYTKVNQWWTSACGTHTCMYPFFFFFGTHSFSDSFLKQVIIEYWEFPMLYRRSLFVIYFIHSSVCMLIPWRFKLQKARSCLIRTLPKGWRRMSIYSVFLFLCCRSSHCGWFLAIVVMQLDGEMGRGMPRGIFRLIRHHRLSAHVFGQAPGVGDGLGGLASAGTPCSPRGLKDSHKTERLNWIDP